MRRDSDNHRVIIEGDDSSMPLERRVSYAARYVLEARNSHPVSVDSVFVYHKSSYRHTIRTKSFVVTPTQIYSVKASFDKGSNEFRRVEINLEAPRGRRDFEVQVVKNQKGIIFVIPYLGDMKLPAIMAEKDDIISPEEIAQRLKTLVAEGDIGWQDSPVHQLALSDAELQVMQVYVRLMRFETMIRSCIFHAIRQAYGNDALNRIRSVLDGEMDKVRARMQAVSDRYGVEGQNIDDSNLLEFLGFEHYIVLMENNGIWEKSLRSIFKDRYQTIEGLKVIRDVRNEIAHFRQSVHANLWAASSMYMDVLEGKVRMTDPGFRRLVEIVKGTGS